MKGDVGPYIQVDGPRVYVPRIVSYLEARRIAQGANQDDSRLAYDGKADRELLGFTVECPCDEVCERRVETGDTTCIVPVWQFTLVER